jgi:hypothetical protein
LLPSDHPAVHLLSGPLFETERTWPLLLHAVLCDLRPRFIAKGQLGGSYRAVTRNGRILLASRLPLADLPGRSVQVRLQTWHKVILPGSAPEPYGILLCVQLPPDSTALPTHATRLQPSPELPDAPFDLALEVGGGLSLTFVRLAELPDNAES